MKKLFLALALFAIVALSSCGRRCHCYGYDGSHTYFTKEDLAEYNTSCNGMEQYMYGIVYSVCEYDFTNY